MLLLNPARHDRFYPDAESRELMRKVIGFFESRGNDRIQRENARLYSIDGDLLDQIFDCLVRDMSRFALELYGKPSSSDAQMAQCSKMIRKPAPDPARADRVWEEQVFALRDAYEMAR